MCTERDSINTVLSAQFEDDSKTDIEEWDSTRFESKLSLGGYSVL